MILHGVVCARRILSKCRSHLVLARDVGTAYACKIILPCSEGRAGPFGVADGAGLDVLLGRAIWAVERGIKNPKSNR